MNQPATPILTILRPLALAAVLLTLGAGCATTDYVTGKRTQNMYTLADEIQLGRSAYLETRNTLQKTDTPINQDPARVALIREITTNIAAVAHITNLTYETTFVGDPDIVNAYAFPGGHMMVFEGLWNETNGLVQTVDELAAVIGHEIAHVNCRHSTEAMTRQMLPNLLLAGGMIWAEIEEKKTSSFFGGLMVVHNGLVVTKYSRKDELEADRVGMFYMAQAGYDPAAAPRVWERLSQARPGQASQPLSIFSTHPRDTLRAQELPKHQPPARAATAAVSDGTRRSDLPTTTPKTKANQTQKQPPAT